MLKNLNDNHDFIEAASSRNLAEMKKLRGSIKGVDCRNEFGQTALIAATRPQLLTSLNQESEVEIVEWLLDEGADLRAVEDNGYSAIHHAAVNGFAEVIKKLLERDCDLVNLPCKEWSPLQLAVKCGQYEAAQILVEKGADVTVKIEDQSLFDLACEIYDPNKREQFITLLNSQNTVFGLKNPSAENLVQMEKAQGEGGRFS